MASKRIVVLFVAFAGFVLSRQAVRSELLADDVAPGGDFERFGHTTPKKPPSPARSDAGRRSQTSSPATQTLADRAAAISKALAPRLPLAVARKQTLDKLEAKLSAAQDADEAKGLASVIAGIWMRSGSDTADLLMNRAIVAGQGGNYPLALHLLDQLVALRPAWAEAWNKRATIRFLTDDLDGSMADIDHVLTLEPRHFGALAGLAAILQRTGFNKRALDVYRRVDAIYPHQEDIEKTMAKLMLEVEGQGI